MTNLNTVINGHVVIRDRATNEVLLDAHNDIHPKNMATAIARGLSNAANSQIFKIKFGNRGTFINGSQQIVFNTPNTVADDADLYNPTYVEIIDDADAGVGIGNSVTFTNIPSTTMTRVIVTCVISANEGFSNPSDILNAGQLQQAGSTTDDGSVSPYFFDELGLFTKQTSGTSSDLNPAGELMLSHLIFSPIEHTGNRELVMTYTLTISVS